MLKFHHTLIVKNDMLLSKWGEAAVERNPIFFYQVITDSSFDFPDIIPFMCGLESIGDPGGCKTIRATGEQGI